MCVCVCESARTLLLLLSNSPTNGFTSHIIQIAIIRELSYKDIKLFYIKIIIFNTYLELSCFCTIFVLFEVEFLA